MNDFKVSVLGYDFVCTSQEEYKENQDKLDKICEGLSEEQKRLLQDVLDFTAYADYS